MKNIITPTEKSIIRANNLYQDCQLFMAECGLPCNDFIKTDGIIHRYSTDAHKNKRDEWYVAYEDVSSFGNHYLICIFGSWSDGSKFAYKSFENAQFNQQEIDELRKIALEKQTLNEQEIKGTHNKIAQHAQELWQSYHEQPPSDAHRAYIRAKGIKEYNGVRFGFNPQGYPAMIIPLQNTEGEIRSLQYISMQENEKSYKSFLAGGEKKGNYHIFGKISADENVFFVCEGYATGATIYEALRQPTVVAFDAYNIEFVVPNLKKTFPKKIFIIAADNDEVGIQKAQHAASKFKCHVLTPLFPENSSAPKSDFNDLCKIAGIAEVKRQLTEGYVSSEAGIQLAQKHFSRSTNPCISYNLSKLPPVLREYIASIQRTTSAHPIIITSSVLTMLSAFLNTKVYIPEGEYFQNLYPNLWILCIAKSGQFKTTALNKGAKIAFERQSQIFSEIKDMRDNLSFNQSETESAILKKSLENVVLPTKMTAEAFLEYLAEGHKGAIFASEFGGWLQNLDKTNNNDFKAIMTELFDVPTYYRYKTKTQGDSVLERPYVSICGVSTLPWVRSNIKPNDVPSGFFARFILFTPPFEDLIPPALPSERISENEWCENNFRSHLEAILNTIGHERVYTLSDQAKNIFIKRHIHIYCVPKICSDVIAELLQPYLKRWSPALLKIAMLIQPFLDPTTSIIEAEAIEIAFHILLPAIKSTIALFEGELGESEHQRKCRIIFDWLKKKTEKEGLPVKRQTILASRQLTGGAKEYDIILEDLIEQGKIECIKLPKKNDHEYSLIDTIETNLIDISIP